jgi:hypothetical protein
MEASLVEHLQADAIQRFVPIRSNAASGGLTSQKA